MRYLVNALAPYEVHVARYYMKRGAYVAAANRAQFAVQNYPQAPAIEEAVFVMVRAYDSLGMNDLRDAAARDEDQLPGEPVPHRRRRAGRPGGSSGDGLETGDHFFRRKKAGGPFERVNGGKVVCPSRA